jgi:hypothetical protein
MSLFSKKETGQVRTGNDPANAQGAAGGYGITQAIALMRSLPVDQNVELVVRVIRSTLESMNVHLPTIIDDALAKEATLQTRIEHLDAEIEQLAEHIDLRRDEISRLQTELKETTVVKERLVLAEKLVTAAALPPPAPPPAPRMPDKRIAAA